MTKHLESDNLIPFRKRENDYHLPELVEESSEKTLDHIDPGLQPEDQGFIRHYLAYADVLLRSAENEKPKSKIIELPKRNGSKKARKKTA